MTTKERLHELVDELTEAEAAATLLITERHRDDAMLQTLASAPVDDEPSSPAEDRSAHEALGDIPPRGSDRPRRPQARPRPRLTEASWTYVITPPARRDLRRLDRPIKRRVVDALDNFVANPKAGTARKLTGSDEWRLRVGDWRVRFSFDDEAHTIVVTHVLPRGRAYDR